ncbi:hypothetical protein HPB48_020348 [Haemaphysalis longicornis]|uniref:SWIM-type domain-containing protein n=1 Tax=Haemaphysalis longicornis TaxID=44386 RepID=A0A9J6GPN0_HAELO|nr:hypothetical protein HPB48_020348 [Haemaphysalis longicornis]
MDQEQLEAAVENLPTRPHQDYINRVEKFLGCQEEWVIMYRAGLMTRGHNTNNYSESSMRILKDIVLCRTKAYNAVALTEYIAVEWEEYFEKRLLRHANDREESHRLCYEHLMEKLGSVSARDIAQLEENTYSVPSSSDKETLYTVQADLGTCSCWAGSQGAFCKHQALVQDTFGGLFPNGPKLTLEDRLQLGYLALGNRCPPPEFFQPLLPVLPNKAHDDEAVSEPLGALQGPQGHIGSQEAPTCSGTREELAGSSTKASVYSQLPIPRYVPAARAKCLTCALNPIGLVSLASPYLLHTFKLKSSLEIISASVSMEGARYHREQHYQVHFLLYTATVRIYALNIFLHYPS